MPANGRNSFTHDDDTLLVKYLAKYNPGVQGRSGNKIYQLLVQNEHNKWGWSSRHPWDGWRNRYIKNQTEFNRRIKAYQIKKGLPTENSHYVNGTQKLKGSDDEGLEAEEPAEEPKLKRKRESPADARKRTKVAMRHDVEEDEAEAEGNKDEDATESESDDVPEPAPAPTRRRTHVPDIYPDIAVLDEPRNIPPKPSPHKQAPPRPAPKVKRTLSVRHDPDSDYFQSVPPTPTTTTDLPSRPPTTASAASVTSNTSVHEPEPAPAPPPSPKPKSRGLPKLFEGTFRTVFQGVRQWAGGDAKSDDGSPQKEWPPRRVRNGGLSNGKAGDSMEVEQQSDAARKKKTVTGSKNASTEQAGNRIEVEQHSEVGNGESVSGPRDAPTESAADDMEIEERSEIAQEKATPSVPLPARRPSPQVNAVASSSRVRLPVSSSRQAQSIASPELQSQPIRTPPFQRSQAPQPSSHRRSPMQSPSRRHHDTQRSPSPLDWGSPTTANPGSPMTARTPATSPSKQRAVPPRQPSPLPFDNVARSDRHSLSRRDVGGSPRASTSRALPRLFFTESGSNGGGSLRNRHRSIGSVEHNSLARRSRAASPRSDAHRTQYRLGSPPRASSSRPQSGTPLATKARRHAPAVAASLPFGFKLIPQQPADEPRRHSFPAALPRVDFHSMHSSSAPASAPRQSLPPRAPPRRAPPPQRRHSLFSPRAPPASTSVSPVHFSISANDRPLIEQLGLQTLMAMAQNHGFNMEVVRNLYARTGDLQKTDEILLRMRQTAEAAGEAALRGGDETPPVPEPPEDASFAQHHLRRHSVAATTRTAARSPPEPPEERFVLRHRREHSGATATTAPRSPPSAPSSSQRKKRQQLEEDEFHPQPLARDVLADTEYTPPSGSRAGAIARAKKKGRMEEGLQRERERATVSGGETLSAFARDARMRAQGRRLDMENDVPRAPTPQFAAFAQGNVRVMRGLEERDVSLAILQTGEVARYMADRTVPRAYR